MPTNLPPEYFEVEKRYRAAQTPQEKVAFLEELISTIPKHKGTDKLRADLRKRLSKLKASAETRKGVSKQESVFHIEREGAGQVAIVGLANVGKSALLTALTNATPEVADYPYTTWVPTPGMMPVNDIQIQLIDTPPLSDEFVEPQLIDLIRRSDLLLLVVDLQMYPIEQLEDAVAILEEHRIIPANRKAFYADARRMTFVPSLIIVNKADDEQYDEDFQVLGELLANEWPLLAASATTGRHLEELKQRVYQQLDIMRIYSKPPGEEPDLDVPYVLKKGSSVAEFASKVHRDFYENLKTARIWGHGVYDGQLVGRDHILHDGDVVELRM